MVKILHTFINNFLFSLKRRRTIKNYSHHGIEICAPFSISNLERLKIESPCYIGPNAWISLRADLSIGSGTIIGPRLKVHTSNHRWDGEMLPYDDIYIAKPVIIDKNVWIGADVTIMPGVHIGEGAIIAACSCITKDVPPLALVAGVPAQIKKFRDKHKYEKLKHEGKIYLQMKHDGKTITNEEQRIHLINR